MIGDFHIPNPKGAITILFTSSIFLSLRGTKQSHTIQSAPVNPICFCAIASFLAMTGLFLQLYIKLCHFERGTREKSSAFFICVRLAVMQTCRAQKISPIVEMTSGLSFVVNPSLRPPVGRESHKPLAFNARNDKWVSMQGSDLTTFRPLRDPCPSL